MNKRINGLAWMGVVVACLMMGVILGGRAYSESAQDFYFESFVADYYLEKAQEGRSELRVEEKLTAVFPDFEQNHGIVRVIPYTNDGGYNTTVLDAVSLNLSVKRNGTTEPKKVSRNSAGKYFEVRIGDADKYVTGTQVYDLKYKFIYPVLSHSDGEEAWQELYWDTNGTGWGQSFGSLTARIHLGDEITALHRGNVKCYVGVSGEKGEDRCQIKKTEDGYEFSTGELAGRENLTFVIDFEPGTFATRDNQRQEGATTVVNEEDLEPDYAIFYYVAAAGVAGVGMMGLFALISCKGRKLQKQYNKRLIVPEYVPPRDWTVAEMARNYMGTAIIQNTKVATMLEMIVQKKVELVRADEKSWRVRVKNLELTPWELDLLKILARQKRELAVGDEIELVSAPVRNMEDVFRDYDQQIDRSLQRKGVMGMSNLTGSPEQNARAITVGKKVFLLLWSAVMVVIVLGVAMATTTTTMNIGSGKVVVGQEWGTWIVVGLLIWTIAVAIFGVMRIAQIERFKGRNVERGMEMSFYLDGMRLYIKMAEQERLKFLQSVTGAEVTREGVVKLYEKMLPYAALFGLEKSWLKEMAKYYRMAELEMPEMYAGVEVCASVVNRVVLTSYSTVESGSSGTSERYSSSSSSSRDSGFSSGGGHSGGGGGGGGGSGW